MQRKCSLEFRSKEKMRLFAILGVLQVTQASCPLDSFDSLNATDTDWINCDGGLLTVKVPTCLIKESGIVAEEINIGKSVLRVSSKLSA